MFDHINQHQEKLFNLSKIILIVVTLILSITVIYFMLFYKNMETNRSTPTANIEVIDTTSEP